MSDFGSAKASRVYRALLRIGWKEKTVKSGSHIQLHREGYPDYTWAFHDSEEIGRVMLRKIAKKTGLKPDDI